MIDLDQGLTLSMVSAAAFIGFSHTLLGADHYLPFVTLARAQKWSWRRTLLTVTACGIAHEPVIFDGQRPCGRDTRERDQSAERVSATGRIIATFMGSITTTMD